MPAGRFVSRVFDFGDALFSRLESVEFAPHPESNTVPPVVFGHEAPDRVNEAVFVALDPQHDGTEFTRLSPAGRDEFLTFDVVGWSHVPNVKTPKALWDRLAELSAGIESVAYDTAGESVETFGVDGEVYALVQSVVPDVAPEKDGWVGSVTVTFRLFANI